MIVLPTLTTAAFYEFEIDLEQRTFKFRFHWNERDAAWYFEILDANGVSLLAGRRVVVDFPLIGRFHDPRLPPGEITALDTSNQGQDPGLADLGERVLLIYSEAAVWGR